MSVYCIIFPKGKASMLNETLRGGSSEAHHGLGCLSPCQDTLVQLFFFCQHLSNAQKDLK